MSSTVNKRRYVPSFATIQSIARQSPRWVVGVAIVTPAVALMQGAALLIDYRKHHLDSPYPVSPSQGVVVSRSTTKGKSLEDGDCNNDTSNMTTGTTLGNSNPPLRLLVIGDSLAAGVGVINSATPVLPESIARTLSRKMGGRPVYWTCIGTPGNSLREIIRDIETHDQKLLVRHDSTVPQRRPLWQEAVEEEASSWHLRRERIAKWWKQRLERDGTRYSSRESNRMGENRDDEGNDEKKPNNPLIEWWVSTKRLVKDDIESFKTAWEGPPRPQYDDDDEDEFDRDDEAALLRTKINPRKEDPFQLWQRWKRRLQRRRSLQGDTATVGQYDIAVVMTGANDVKHAWLPFLMWNVPDPTQQRESDAGASMQDGLTTVVTTLQRRMKFVLDAAKRKDQSKLPQDQHPTFVEAVGESMDETLTGSSSRNPPLVVFPAMPVTMIPTFQTPPMSWFIFWIFRRLEEYKRTIAKQFPGAVVFVEPPPLDEFLSEDGARVLEEIKPAGEVMMALTNVTQKVRTRVERIMKEHREKWAKVLVEDQEDRDRQNKEKHHHPDEISSTFEKGSQEDQKRSIMLSVDDLHPSDEGYEIWGRHIAGEILKQWNLQD